VAASLAIVLTLGLVWGWLGRRPVADRQGIVVAGFENRTGDTALAAIGEIATDYIARGLASTGLIHDVYDSRTTAMEAGGRIQAGPGPARDLARRVGVGTVLWGSYYLQDDSLHFEAQLVDAGTGRMILALAPAVGALSDRTRVIETLRQRVMAGFAVAVNPAFAPWHDRTAPPTYDAYLELMAADEAGWTFDWSEALKHLRRAASIDSTFLGAQTAQAEALALNGECAAADSVVRSFEPRRMALSPLQRAQLDWAATCGTHDREGRYRAALAMLVAAPKSVGATVLASIAATEANRPRAALEILLRYDPRALNITGRRLTVYRNWVASAYHALGEHQRELTVAREGLGEAPSYVHLEVNEAAALAALGETAAAESLAGSWLDRQSDEDWDGQKAECVALELRAHGHALASRRLMERTDAWYKRRGFDQAADAQGRIPCLWTHFSPTYYIGDWETATRQYQRRLARDTGDFLAHAALGALAARRGDQATADSMDRWLARRTDGGNAAYARARIALLLGDRARAWQLLRQAHDGGFLAPDHIDPDLEPLRGDSAYRELFRPRG
jgi:TolB-like protein